MNSERDRFLTEAMGIYLAGAVLNFSTWQCFGKLWEWAQEQDWWVGFLQNLWFKRKPKETISKPHHAKTLDLIHPDRFADAVYTFLKEQGE